MTKSFLKLFISLLFLFTSYSLSQEAKENSDFKLALSLYNDKMIELALEQFKNFITTYPKSPQSIDAKYYIGLCLMNLENYEDARISFQNFALTYPEHPRSPEAWYNVGEIYTKIGNFKEAALAYERVKTFFPKSQLAPKALLESANNFKKINDLLNARKNLNYLIQEYNKSELVIPARLSMVEIYIEEGSISLAISETKKILEISQNYRPDALLLLGKIYSNSFQYKEAEENLLKLINEYKNSITAAEANFELAYVYKKTKNYEKAIQQFNISTNEKLLDSSKREKALFELAKLYLEISDYSNAFIQFKTFLKNFPNSKLLGEALYWTAYSAENSKYFNEALDLYDKLINEQINKELATKAYIRASFTAEKNNNIILAISYCENLLKSQTENIDLADVQLRIAELYKNKLKNYERAIVYYENALNTFANSNKLFQILYNIAECQELAGNYAAAINGYSYITQKNPSSIEALTANERIEFIKTYKQTDYETATKHLMNIFSDFINNNQNDYNYKLGEIYFTHLKDYLSAASTFGRASELSQSVETRSNSEYKKALSYDLYHVIDSTYLIEAIKSYENFIYKYPQHEKFEEALYNLIKLYYKNNFYDEVIKLTNLLQSKNPTSPFLNDAQYLLADLNFKTGKTHEALLLFRKLSEINDKKYFEISLKNLGIYFYEQAKHDSALYYFEKLIKKHPLGFYAPLSTFYIGKILIQQNKYLQAAEYFKKFFNDYYYSQYPEGLNELYITSLIEAGMYEDALYFVNKQINSLKRNLFTDTDTLLYKFHLAKIYYKKGENQKAEKLLKEFVSLTSESNRLTDAYLMLGEMAKNQGKTDIAAIYFRLAGEFGSTIGNKDIAEILYIQARYNEAALQYNKLLSQSTTESEKQFYLSRLILCKLKSDDLISAQDLINKFKNNYKKSNNELAEFEYEKALVYYRKKDYNNAKKFLEIVTNNFKNTKFSQLSEYYLAKITELSVKVQDAIKKYQNIITKYPKSEAAYRSLLSLGNIYFNLEKYEEAIPYYQEIVSDKDKSGEIIIYALSNLIEAYESIKLYDAALKTTRDYIMLYPNASDIADKKIKLGILYTRSTYYDQAILHFQTLLNELGNDYEAEIRYNLGEAFYYKGDYQQAILEFLKIPYLVTLKGEIDWTATSFYMAGQSYEKLGKFDQAINMYQQIIDRKDIDPKFKAGAYREIERVRSIIKKGRD